MSIVLAIDTTQIAAHLQLLDDNQLLGQKTWPAGRDITDKLLTAITELLTAAHLQLTDIQKITVRQNEGHPGSTRTGLVVATMLAEGLGCPVELQ